MLRFLTLLAAIAIDVKSDAASVLNENENDNSHASAFVELRCNSRYFVDKTLLIEEILQHSERIVWIVRAKNWGKTVNLNMVKMFLQMEVDGHGNKLPPGSKRKNSQLFLGGFCSRCGRNLTSTKISFRKDIIEEHMARYPVVQLNCGGVDAYENAEAWANGLIKKLYNDDFKYVEKYTGNRSVVETRSEELLLKKIYSTDRLDEDELRASLRLLVRILFNIYGSKSYLLLDDYDAPYLQLLQRPRATGGLPEPEPELNTTTTTNEKSRPLMLASMLDDLLGGGADDYLKGGLITGVIPVSPARQVAPFNRVYSIVDEKFSTYYGFQESEVQQLMQRSATADILTNGLPWPDAIGNMREWYDGYRTPRLHHLYNPLSVTECLRNNGTLGEYWTREAAAAADVDFLKNYLTLHFVCDLQNAVYDEGRGYAARNSTTNASDHSDSQIYIGTTLPLSLSLSPSPTDGVTYEKQLNTASGLFGYLLYAGYLNVSKHRDNDTAFHLSVPNVEIRTFLTRTLVTWQSTLLNVEERYILEHRRKNLLSDLLEWNTNEFKTKLAAVMEDAKFDRNAATRQFYVGLLLALLQTDGKLRVALHEYVYKKGGPGLVYVPLRDVGINSAVILEVKVRPTTTVSDNAQTIKQIKFTAYDQRLLRDNSHLDRLMKMVVTFHPTNFTCHCKVILA